MSDAMDTVVATVTGNLRVTEGGREHGTHHIMLDLGKTPLPALEGQSIGIVAPGIDASGRPHRFAVPRFRSMAAGLRNGGQTPTTGPDRLGRDPN